MNKTTPAVERNLSNKQFIHSGLYKLANARGKKFSEQLRRMYSENADWRGAHPFNAQPGVANIEHKFWLPLLTAFPDCERRDLIVIGGSYEGRDYVGTMGHYCGTWRRDWLGIPASNQPTYLRYGEVHQIKQGHICQSTVLIDVLDAIRQAGLWPIAPSLGAEGTWPGPITGDGIVLYPTDPEQSARNLKQTLDMHKTLADYNDFGDLNRESLLNMPQKQHWHSKMMWYGPSGIGSTRGLAGFVDNHQLPFRIAFPNRQGGAQITNPRIGGHYIRIGDGNYSLTGGWPSVIAQHSGGNFLGTGPTGRQIKMRVMDFYLHHERRIRENWVPLDILDVLRQMGVYVLERMRLSI